MVFDGSTTSNININDKVLIEFPQFIFGVSSSLFNHSWFTSIIFYIVMTFTFYIIGWLISAGFYRFSWFIGLGFIVLAIISAATLGWLWMGDIDEPLSNWIPSTNLPLYGVVLGTMVIIGLILWIIRLLTRRATIKM